MADGPNPANQEFPTILGPDASFKGELSFEKGMRVPFDVMPRGAIDGVLAGPAIITEGTCTTYLDADWTARIGTFGEVIMERKN